MASDHTYQWVMSCLALTPSPPSFILSTTACSCRDIDSDRIYDDSDRMHPSQTGGARLASSRLSLTPSPFVSLVRQENDEDEEENEDTEEPPPPPDFEELPQVTAKLKFKLKPGP